MSSNRRVQMTIPSILAEGEQFDLRISTFGADGLPTDDVTREMYPAFYDPDGQWTVRATDIATGMTAEAQVTVAGEPEE